MTATTATVTAWSEHTVEVDGRSWAYRSAGTGEPVLVLDPADAIGSLDVLESLTGRRRVIVARLPRGIGADEHVARLTGLLQALAVTRCAVIARGGAAAAALRLAAERDDLVDMLVLESPELDAALVERLPGIEAPTLVLLGQRTEAATPTRAGAYKRLPGSTLGLVYDAGVDVRGDRPSAWLAAVSDYLERGQAFVVNTQTTVIND